MRTGRKYTIIGFVKGRPCIFSILPYYLRHHTMCRTMRVKDFPASFSSFINENYPDEFVEWIYFEDLSDQQKEAVRNARIESNRFVGKPQSLVIGFVNNYPAFCEYRTHRTYQPVDRFMRLSDWYDPRQYPISERNPEEFVLWIFYDDLPSYMQSLVKSIWFDK